MIPFIGDNRRKGIALWAFESTPPLNPKFFHADKSKFYSDYGA